MSRNASCGGPHRSGIGLAGLALLAAAGPERMPLAAQQATSLGPSVNTKAADFAPQISPDGRRLYFTSTRKGGTGGEDIWFLEQLADGWSEPRPMPSPINSKRHEGVASFSGDGQTMVYSACLEPPAGLGSCDLFIATLIGDEWSVPTNLGAAVNTPQWDAHPSLSADGATLIFSSGRPGGSGGKDLWMTRRNAAGAWGVPVNLGPTVNTPGDEESPYLAPDGKTLYFSSNGHPSLGGMDIFRTTRLGDARPAPIAAAPPAPGPAVGPPLTRYEGTWLAPGYEYGAQVLLVTAADNRVSGNITWTLRRSPRPNETRVGLVGVEHLAGSFDPSTRLFQLEGVRKDDPNNVIGLDSYRLMLSPDGSTLSGTSRAGGSWSGRFELTRAAVQPGAPVAAQAPPAVARTAPTMRWAKPVNVGRPFNSEQNDQYFTVAGAGDVGFFASNRPGGSGGLDLYFAPLPEALRPEPAVIVRGVVTDRKTGSPIGADVVIEDLEAGARIAGQASNTSTGEYLVVLPSGRSYGVSVSRSGYFFFSARFEVPTGSLYQEQTQDIALAPVEPGATLVLNNIFFETAKSDLLPTSRLEVERTADLLRANPTITVELGGHTDNVGTAEGNQRLSEARATVVRRALIAAGIDGGRLVAKGYGAARPVGTNDTEEGRAANRRTELVVLSK